jgi:hypothetical protein
MTNFNTSLSTFSPPSEYGYYGSDTRHVEKTKQLGQFGNLDAHF